MTDAHELLQPIVSDAEDPVEDASHDGFEYTARDEKNYRDMCELWVQCGAEPVEDMKADGMFREWLKGNTDGASHWRNFFLATGGLLPKKLRAQLEEPVPRRKKRLAPIRVEEPFQQ
jgi:hypothetical protein